MPVLRGKDFDSVSACRTGKRDFIRFSGCYLRIESGQYPLVCPYFYHDSHCGDGFKDDEVCEILMIVVGVVHLFFHASQWLYYIAGALFMGVFLLMCALLFKKVTGKAGLGLGDIEFMACIGLCIGFGHLLALIVGCLLGAVIQGGIQLYHKKSGRFPTTPYLAMGVYLVLLWGDTVLNWYVRTFVY